MLTQESTPSSPHLRCWQCSCQPLTALGLVCCPAPAMGSQAGSPVVTPDSPDRCQTKKTDLSNFAVLKSRTVIQKLHSVADLRLCIERLFTINTKVWRSQGRKRNPNNLNCANTVPWLGYSCGCWRGTPQNVLQASDYCLTEYRAC